MKLTISQDGEPDHMWRSSSASSSIHGKLRERRDVRAGRRSVLSLSTASDVMPPPIPTCILDPGPRIDSDVRIDSERKYQTPKGCSKSKGLEYSEQVDLEYLLDRHHAYSNS